MRRWWRWIKVRWQLRRMKRALQEIHATRDTEE